MRVNTNSIINYLNVTMSNVTKSNFQLSIVNCQFFPVRLVGLLNPFVAIPAGDDFPKSCLATETALQGSQVIHRKNWCQLVEDGMVASVSDALVASINKLILECLAKSLYLLFQTVLGHHQRELDCCFRLLVQTPPGLP